METLKTLVVSTTHVTLEDVKRMVSDSSNETSKLSCLNGYYSVAVMLPPEEEIEDVAVGYSESTVKLLHFGLQGGFGMVVLDRDGETIVSEQLNTHDW